MTPEVKGYKSQTEKNELTAQTILKYAFSFQVKKIKIKTIF